MDKKAFLLILIFGVALSWIVVLNYLEEKKYSQKDWDKIENDSDVGFTVSAIKIYKNNTGFMPDTINEIIHNDPLPNDWRRLEEIFSNKKIKYSKVGFRDNLGNSWLVILKDDKYPDVFFVGKFMHSEIVARSTFVQDPFEQKGNGTGSTVLRKK